MKLHETLDRMRCLMVSENATMGFDLKQLSALPSFNQRIKYCAMHLPRISSGSSRIVYDLGQTAIKLAKNEKGLEQNLAEADGWIQQQYESIVAKVLQYDQDDKWIVVEKARKATVADFPRLLGISFKTLVSWVSHIDDRRQPGVRVPPVPQEITNIEDESHFVWQLEQFVSNTDKAPGDFKRINSFGVVNRNGQEHLVLIDYGLTQDLLDSSYRE